MRYLGYHDAAWRHPDVPSGGSSDYQHFLRCAQTAERGKFDMVFFADGIGVRANDEPPGSLSHSNRNVELEPLTLLSALAPMTRHIGLVCTASTTYNEPYHIARKFASLDHISGGRAGWNIVTSWSEQEAWNFSRDTHLDYDTRYERAREFVDVAAGLWDSWEADAFVHDKALGQFYDPAKLHTLHHRRLRIGMPVRRTIRAAEHRRRNRRGERRHLARCTCEAEVAAPRVVGRRTEPLGQALPQRHRPSRQRQLGRVSPRLPHAGERPSRCHRRRAVAVDQDHIEAGRCELVGGGRAADPSNDHDDICHHRTPCVRRRVSSRTVPIPPPHPCCRFRTNSPSGN